MTGRKLAAVLLLLLAAGCGVQPTGAVPAGEAPSIPDNRLVVKTPGDATLYFLVRGGLYGSSRSLSGQTGVDAALNALLSGPDARESAAGMVTLLPRVTGPVKVWGSDVLTIQVPFAIKGLPELALSQLVCTAVTVTRYSSAGGALNGVNLGGTDGPPGYRECHP